MKKFLCLMILITANIVFAQDEIKVALIDTGVYPLNSSIKEKVVNIESNVTDFHGTDLACILSKSESISTIYSYNHNKTFEGRISGLKDAIRKNVSYIVYTSSGEKESKKERYLLELASKRGIKILVSAGNESKNLDISKIYPCSYNIKNLICVGNKEVYSNYGDKVIRIEKDNEIDCLNTLSGTSQSTAIYLKELLFN